MFPRDTYARERHVAGVVTVPLARSVQGRPRGDYGITRPSTFSAGPAGHASFCAELRRVAFSKTYERARDHPTFISLRQVRAEFLKTSFEMHRVDYFSAIRFYLPIMW